MHRHSKRQNAQVCTGKASKPQTNILLEGGRVVWYARLRAKRMYNIITPYQQQQCKHTMTRRPARTGPEMLMAYAWDSERHDPAGAFSTLPWFACLFRPEPHPRERAARERTRARRKAKLHCIAREFELPRKVIVPIADQPWLGTFATRRWATAYAPTHQRAWLGGEWL
jgi:hypothetical protein